MKPGWLRSSLVIQVLLSDELDRLCAAAGHGIGQTSRCGCLYSSAEGHARVCPIPPVDGGAARCFRYYWYRERLLLWSR